MTNTLFSEKNGKQNNQWESFDLYSFRDILPDLIKDFPRNFEVSTNNGKYKFNKDLIYVFIPNIGKAIKENNDINEYHLDINDEQNVMKKVESLFKGESVDFFKSEAESINKITPLFIKNIFPDSMHVIPPTNNDKLTKEKEFPERITLKINIPILFDFIRKLPRIFTIKTNKNEYKCNSIGILCSTTILSFLKSFPNSKEFNYNFNEEKNEFQMIANFFNGCNILFSKQNKDILLLISQQLDMKQLSGAINAFTQKVNENISKSIEHQKILEPYNELFENLFNIKRIGSEKVFDYIMNSKWIKSKLEVQEFVACILHVIKNNFVDHSILANLIRRLSEQANSIHELSILIQFLIDKLFLDFTQNNEYASFLYHLYRNDLISIDLIIKKIFIKINNNSLIQYNTNKAIDFSIIWFLPELFDRKIITNNLFERKNSINDKVSQIKEIYGKNDSIDFLADKIRLMRDDHGQSDSIIQSIQNDDINTFQTIVSQNGIDIHSQKIQMTFFDDFQGEISFIDYAAFCGSLKCFKYLFLENVPFNSDTFMYSIQGYNTEIIRILDQNKDKFVKTNKKGQFGYLSQSDKSMIKAIETAIKMHKNDIFDWIFENKIEIDSDYDYTCLLRTAVINGNAYAICQIIEKILNLSGQSSILVDIITKACLHGFYTILKYLSHLISFSVDELFDFKKHINSNPCIRKPISILSLNKFQLLENSVRFGILSIFELVLKYQKVNSSSDLFNVLIEAIKLNNVDIVKYILDNKIYELSPLFLIKAIICSIENDSENVINYFLENEFPITNEIFYAACCSTNAKLVDHLIQKANEKHIYIDFNKSFEKAICSYSDEIIKIFIKYKVNFNLIEKLNNYQINPKIIVLLINNLINSEMRNELINESLNCVLYSNDIETLKFLISNHVNFHGLLIMAVKLSNLEVIKTILDYNHSLEFINEVGPDGTALFEAVKNSKNDIVKYLLQMKGIDPSISVDPNKTPLIEAVTKNNVEVVDLILDFYGDNIKDQGIQINNAFNQIQNSMSQKKKHSKSRNTRNFGFGASNRNDANNAENDSKLIFDKLSSIKNLIYFDDTEDSLSNAIIEKNVSLVEKLLKDKSIDLTKKLPFGNTYLHLAIEGSEITPIEKLLISQPKIDINISNALNETPLIKAVQNKNEELVDLILNHPKFNPVLSQINYAFYLSIKSKNISRKIIQIKSLDVNYKYQKDDLISNPLIESVKIDDFELIKLIISRPSFSPIKSKIKDCLFLTVELKNSNVFKFFLKLNGNDVNLKNKDDQSLLYFAYLKKNDEIFDEILENENFDPNKSDIQNVFININDIDSIKKLIFYDEEHHYNLLTLEKIELKIQLTYQQIKLIDFMNNCVGYNFLLRKKEILPKIQSICTSIVSKQSKLYQQLYLCETCSNQILCEICAKVCHKGHRIIEVKDSLSGDQSCNCSKNCKCKSITNNYHDEIYDKNNPLFDKNFNQIQYHIINDDNQKEKEEFQCISNLSKEIENNELRCTLDLAGFHPISQPIYHCKKCQIEICQNCAIKCHKSHSLEYIGIKPNSLCYCLNITDCKCTERKDVVCSFAFYGKKYIDQPWFNCNTCGMIDSNGCCAACAKKCHHNHDIHSNGFLNSYCNCSANAFDVECKAFQFPPFDYLSSCTNRDLKYEPKNQRMYHCLTCGIMSSTQGICEACAIHCHIGHNVVFVGLKEFVCECFSVNNNILESRCVAPMCPAMKNNEICKSENYNKDAIFAAFVCFTCDKNGEKKICESCAVKCHKNHDVHFIEYSNFKCHCEPCKCIKNDT